MAPQDPPILTNGSSLAAALDAHREKICTTLSSRLAASFPMLCYDYSRIDGRAFQQMMLRRTPQRLHTLIQTALRTNNLLLIEREYKWVWIIVQRFGVNRQHLIAQVYWYFDVARTLEFEDADRQALRLLEKEVMLIVEHVTTVPNGAASAQRGRSNGQAPRSN